MCFVVSDYYFVRSLDFVDLYRTSVERYRLDQNTLSLESHLFDEPMSLVPIGELDKLYLELSHYTKDADFVMNTMSQLPPSRLGSLGRWLLSARDFSMCVRRLNNGMSYIHSGSVLKSSVVGNIYKWVYDVKGLSTQMRVHDSIRYAIYFVKVLRSYIGEGYAPYRVMLCGSRENHELYESFFGCEVTWNQQRTEVWFPSSYRYLSEQVTNRSQVNLAMTFNDLDNLLDMPSPDDEIKVTSEVIRYCRYYGFPTIEKVSALMGLSVQQLQRRLSHHEVTFRTLSGFVFSHYAVEQMIKGRSPQQISISLGYRDITSFNRMFKLQRGISPRQFIQQLELD